MPPPGTLPPTPNPGGPPSTPGGGPPTGPRPSPPGAKGMAGMAPPPTNQPAQQQQPGLLPPSAHAALTQSGPAKIPVGAVKMPGAGSPGPIQRSLSTSDGPQPGMPPNNNTPSSRKPSTFAASPFAKFMPGPPKQPQPQPPGK
jgi:cytokinesis protein